MTPRVKNLIKRSDRPTEQALEQTVFKNKAVFHKKCLSKYDGAGLKRLQADLTEEVGLVSIKYKYIFTDYTNLYNICSILNTIDLNS